MKRAISIASVLVIIIALFVSCNKNDQITDYEGNSHTIVMKNGKPVQDEYGNLIEKYTDSNGQEVTQPITFPNVTSTADNEIENAFFTLEVPENWKYDDSIRAFRIQHKDKCTNDDGFCEVSVEVSQTESPERIYESKLGIAKGVELEDENLTGEIKEFKPTLFGSISSLAFSKRYSDGMVNYFYVFEYKGKTVSIRAYLNDGCFEKGFDGEDFINKYFTLKDLG